MIEPLKDAKILIVDDQEINIQLLTEFLKVSGYTNIESITKAEKCVDSVRRFQPDLLLLDLMMPNLSGYDVMQLLNENGLMSEMMPVLVLTSDISNEAKEKSLELGASDFLTKPFQMTETRLRIRNLLQKAYLFKEMINHNALLEEKVMERTLVLHKTNKELRVEKRRVEEQLAIIKKKNETLRDISWTQSHLVRAPLARMHSLIDLIKDHNSTEEERNEYLDYFETSLQELDVVIASISKKTYDENDENINN